MISAIHAIPDVVHDGIIESSDLVVDGRAREGGGRDTTEHRGS